MFQIDYQTKIPVYEQIINQVEELVLKDILPENSKLPSVRNLSLTLSVNPNTIQKAFSELDRRNIIYSVPGKGSFVSPEAKSILSQSRLSRLTELTTLAEELKLAGIDKKQLIQCINEVYGREIS